MRATPPLQGPQISISSSSRCGGKLISLTHFVLLLKNGNDDHVVSNQAVLLEQFHVSHLPNSGNTVRIILTVDRVFSREILHFTF